MIELGVNLLYFCYYYSLIIFFVPFSFSSFIFVLLYRNLRLLIIHYNCLIGYKFINCTVQSILNAKLHMSLLSINFREINKLIFSLSLKLFDIFSSSIQCETMLYKILRVRWDAMGLVHSM
jgi:hypothetical protein